MCRWAFVAVATLLLTTGCADRLVGAPQADRGLVLASCARLIHPMPRSLQGMLQRLGHVENCMAGKNLPGHARYDRNAGRVLFAYEADQPILRF